MLFWLLIVLLIPLMLLLATASIYPSELDSINLISFKPCLRHIQSDALVQYQCFHLPACMHIHLVPPKPNRLLLCNCFH